MRYNTRPLHICRTTAVVSDPIACVAPDHIGRGRNCQIGPRRPQRTRSGANRSRKTFHPASCLMFLMKMNNRTCAGFMRVLAVRRRDDSLPDAPPALGRRVHARSVNATLRASLAWAALVARLVRVAARVALRAGIQSTHELQRPSRTRPLTAILERLPCSLPTGWAPPCVLAVGFCAPPSAGGASSRDGT